MRRPAILILLLALVLGLGIVGCGGGDEEAGETGLTDTGSLFPADTGVIEEPPPPPAEPSDPAEAVQIVVPKPGDVIGPSSPAARVAELQEALLALGYKIGKPDGIYGGKTRKAVVRFQKSKKLEADGLVGAKTAKAINKELRKLASG